VPDAAAPLDRPAPRIRTPDQRVRVFVSSTLQELAPERAAARQAISRLRLTPVLFELGARPHPPRDLYQAYLAQSDIFLGVYWQRYGWVAPGMEISGLEDEYVLSAGKPKLIYVKSPAPDREPGLQALLRRIQADNDVSYKPFTTPDELGELIENDLALLLTERFSAAAPAPPPPPAARPRTNLPVQRGRLIGRDAALAGLRALLARPDVGLVTLTGPGGAGKTRLALAVAGGLLDAFPDGVFAVALAPISDPALVAPTIAAALGVRETGGRPLEDVLVEDLRDRRLLLVLDNYEQVVESAPLVARLLESSPGLTVLVTSRRPLRLQGEIERPVPALDLPAPDAPLGVAALARLGAVELFVERARETQPDFQLTERNAAAVAEICRRLDGLPLAIELAAARVKLLPPPAMLARLDARLPLLTGGAHDLPVRQQTMRAAIEWSYDLLDAADQTLFRRLAVFVGGCTLDAVEAVCRTGDDTPDLLDGLSSLMEKSLLAQREGPDNEPRFRLLQTIHEYARDQLAASGEAAEMGRRHAAYFLGFVRQAEPHILAPEREVWLPRLEAELGNIRAVIAAARAGAGDTLGATETIAPLGYFCYFLGHLREGVAWCEWALAQPALAAPSVLRARLLHAAGGLGWALGDYAGAETRLTEAVRLFRDLREPRRLAGALTNLGLALVSQGDPAGGRALLGESRDLFATAGDRWGQTFALSWYAEAAYRAGDTAAAQPLAEEALTRWQELDDEWGKALPCATLGCLAWARAAYDDARRFYERAAALFEAAGDKFGRARVLIGLADATWRLQDFDRARALLQECLTIWRALGQEPGVTLSLAEFASLAVAEGQPERAARLFGAAGDVFEQVGFLFSGANGLEFARSIAAARSHMEETAWICAWQEGEAMSREQAIAYALAPPVPG
jgi:predicted ATPase